MIFEIFSNLNDAMIIIYLSPHSALQKHHCREVKLERDDHMSVLSSPSLPGAVGKKDAWSDPV